MKSPVTHDRASHATIYELKKNKDLMAKLSIKVVPGSSRDRVAGRYGDALKIQVSAPPEDGKANKAVLKVLATFLSVRLEQLSISRGHSQPRKIVEIAGLEQEEVDRRVGAAIKNG